VKAAGGIRDLEALLQVRELGVTRVGASRTAEMLSEARRRLGLPPIAAATGPSAGY
jgi:deoxyribose-phosphate aldolase